MNLLSNLQTHRQKKLYKVYRTFCQNDQDIKKEGRVQLSDKIQISLKEEKRAYIVHRAILDIEGHITERKVRSLKAQNEIELEKISVGYEAEDVSYFRNK